MQLLSYVVLGCLLSGSEDPMVYKCGGAEGDSYQSLPCAGVELGRWSVVPDPIDEQTLKHLAEIRSQLQRDARQSKRGVRPERRSGHAAPKPSACEKVRQGRDRAYAKAGLRRDFAMSSLWDNRVHQACR